jgi:hypothetical protein
MFISPLFEACTTLTLSLIGCCHIMMFNATFNNISDILLRSVLFGQSIEDTMAAVVVVDIVVDFLIFIHFHFMNAVFSFFHEMSEPSLHYKTVPVLS